MITRKRNSARALVTVGMLTLTALAASSTRADAMAKYRVWYFDNVYDAFEEGDVSDGLTKLNPPDWACGVRFIDPSYYRWVNGYGGTMSSADFWKNVHVWIPRPGCPASEPLIEYQDGSASFSHPAGASYMEISTHYAFTWINADGQTPSCGSCVLVGGLMYFQPDYDAGVVLSAFSSLKAALLEPRQQAFVLGEIATLDAMVDELETKARNQIAARRMVHLGDREVSVRSLEDGALRRLVETASSLETGTALTREMRYVEAFTALDLATASLEAAESLLRTAELSFHSSR